MHTKDRMLFDWLKRRRRKRILRSAFPDEWLRIMESNVLHYRHLSEDQQKRLRDRTQIFVAEKNWEGCRGLQMTDEIRVTVAALASLMVLEVQPEVYFDHVLSILVYPGSYVASGVRIGRAGVVMEGGQARLGEAWWRGPVILSWPEVVASGRRESPGQNLVFHEFAHQLDMLNGRHVDGVPPLNSKEQLSRWLDVLGPEYERLVRNCQRGHHGFIDCYGATNAAEFFAVLSEVFFENPHQLTVHHPDTYAVMREYYGQDPVLWPAPAKE